ncbi:MAG: Kae1-associated serine/threonine protein kinase, partial [Nitrososphaerota archaeon]|nr:Kae1-associated serine/threonine protein kinase [Nitrososphaerota archaeon]
DSAIRRQRTVREAEMIGRAKEAGVESPHLFFVDPVGATLVEEFVEGRRLKELADSGDVRTVTRLFERLGSAVAKLHGAGLVHGDITTANVILKGEVLVFIDFGLAMHSARLEDHAVDLRLIKETLTGAHSRIAGQGVEAMMRGYGSVAGDSRLKAVARQLRQIERRGRYARIG